MRSGAVPLDQRPLFQSRDAEETRAFLRGKDFRFELVGRPNVKPDVRVNGVFLDSVYVGYLQYGVPATVGCSPALEEYWIQLPVRGRMIATVASQRIECDPTRGFIDSPTRDQHCPLRLDWENARIHVRLAKADLIAQLTALLGEAPAKPLEFTHALDLTKGYGRSLAGFMLIAAADLNWPEPMLLNPLAMKSFEQFLMTGLLTSHPHSCSDQLRGVERGIAPRDVKRALEFIAANLDAPLTVEQIVAASGVPGRTLYKHFQDCHGVSPMQQLRDGRFRKAYESLLNADPDESVTAIAMRWGFGHMGRFAVEYRKRFGESPSQTLRRRRSGKPPSRGSSACSVH